MRRESIAALRKCLGQHLLLRKSRLESFCVLVVGVLRRWEIETLFAATKTRGLNLEDTHLTHPDRIAKLIAVLAVAFSFAHAMGEWRAKRRPIIIKKHGRRAQSIFRFGFDLLRQILIQGQQDAVQCWNVIATGRPPTSERRSSPKPA